MNIVLKPLNVTSLLIYFVQMYRACISTLETQKTAAATLLHPKSQNAED